MKRGFTLIELLAVIVILAIIALIAVPVVLNIINNAKESSVLRSAEFYLNAAEYTIADTYLYATGLSDGIYPITLDGNICKSELPCTEENTLKVEVTGEKPAGGTIKIESGKISDVSLILNNQIITNNQKGELVYLTLDAVCEHKSGTEKTVGTKYTCDFGGGDRNFYILELGSNPVSNTKLSEDEVALILEGNYDETIQSWCASGADNSCNADGLTSKLDEIATNWMKISRNQIVLPSAEQVSLADGVIFTNQMQNLSSAWLYDWPGNTNYGTSPSSRGYWTSTPSTTNLESAFNVLNMGMLINSNTSPGISGVRPVVNIKL